MSEHTSGPWEINETVIPKSDGESMPFTYIATPEGQFVGAEWFAHDVPNARLIAAAPDLLAACDLALRCMDDSREDWVFVSDAINACKTAIAKARGQDD